MATKRKLPSDDENVAPKRAKVERRLNLAELHIDCLEPIFNFLGLADLLTLAGINANFKAAAHSQFNVRYANSTLIIGQHGVTIGGDNFMFGRLVELLEEFGLGLRRIRIENSMLEILMHLISHTTTQVTDVTVAQCRLEAQMAQLNVWFPKMERLTLSGVNVVDPSCIYTHFPTLTELTVDAMGPIHSLPRQLDGADVRHVLQLNPQLRALTLNVGNGSSLLFDINKWCPGVERLSLSCDTKIRFEGNTELTGVYANVKSLQLLLWNNPLGTLPEAAPPFIRSDLAQKWMKFVMRRHFIEHWPMESNGLYDGTLMRLSALFPNVEQITLFGDLHMFSGFGLTTFVGDLKELQTIRFELMEAGLLNALRQQIDTSCWSIDKVKGTQAQLTVDDEIETFCDVIMKRVVADDK